MLSHILPPSPSGQAVMIYRLLEKIPKERYCLISREDYSSTSLGGTSKLSGKYYQIKTVSHPEKVLSSPLLYIIEPFKVIWDVFSRTYQIIKILKKEKVKTLITCTGGIGDLISGYLAAKLYHLTLAIYVFDDPIYQQTGFFHPLVKVIEEGILKSADKIIAPNEFLEKEYFRRYKFHSFVIHNPTFLPDLSELDKKKTVFSQSKINIVFTGAVYLAHFDAFRNLVKAINLLKKEKVLLHIFTADAPKTLKKEGIGGKNVLFHSHINQAEVAVVQRKADILFLPLAFRSPIPEIIRTSAPGKIGDYMAVGRPILIHAPEDSFVSWYFRKHNCGVVVSEEKPKMLAHAILEITKDRKLSQTLENNALKQARKDFSVEKMRKKFLEFLNK